MSITSRQSNSRQTIPIPCARALTTRAIAPKHFDEIRARAAHSMRAWIPDSIRCSGWSGIKVLVKGAQNTGVSHGMSERHSYTTRTREFVIPCKHKVAPRHGFEPRFTAPKAAVLPLDDRGIVQEGGVYNASLASRTRESSYRRGPYLPRGNVHGLRERPHVGARHVILAE